MVSFIIKKDGTKEPFNTQKIKSAVVSAAIDAGLKEKEGDKIAEEVSNKIAQSVVNLSEVSGIEVRARALSQLDAIAPIVADAWRKYDKINKK